MAVSIGGIGAYNQFTYVRPMNYSVKNQSDVSDAYSEEVSSLGESGLVNPVGYPNAQAEPVSPVASRISAQKAGEQSNELAAQFSGSVTGYGSDSQGLSYGMTGSNFDMLV